jgi:hypothetical protein
MIGVMSFLPPQLGIPLMVGKEIGTIIWMPLVIVALLLVVIGTIMYSTMAKKSPGVMMLVLGMMLGFGAFTMMYVSKKHR